jgi:hypothetical protein
MITGEPVRIRCPVCNGTLCDHLHNEQNVIEQSDRDDLRTTSDVIIVSRVFIPKR